MNKVLFTKNLHKLTALFVCLILPACATLNSLNPFVNEPLAGHIPLSHETSAQDLSNKLMLVEQNIDTQVDLDVAKALKIGDYRLLASSGRQIVVVGIDPERMEELKETCGIKFIPGTGDVLRGENDKEIRRVRFMYAMKYNLKMSTYCLENK